MSPRHAATEPVQETVEEQEEAAVQEMFEEEGAVEELQQRENTRG